MNKIWRRLRWYCLKLPTMMVLMVTGFLMEYLFMAPFMLACLLGGASSHRRMRP